MIGATGLIIRMVSSTRIALVQHLSGRAKFDVLQDTTLPKCDDCFLQPCVAHFRQSWLVGPNLPAKAKNTITRRPMYKKFWFTVDYRGGWQESDYLAKKIRELQRAGYDDEKTVWVTALGSVQREIMPQCVLTLVGSLCPNPPGQPYTGDRWN